jgi:acyl-CoA synthetase (AMP-forming)/AMP-acid ligase II
MPVADTDERWTVPTAATTFAQLIRAAAATYGDAEAIRLTGDAIPEDSATFARLDRDSALLARGLLARGVGKGSRLGFIHGNGPAFATVLAAIARIGAIAVPISTTIRANELVRVLRQSDVAGLIVQRRFLGIDYVSRLREALPELDHQGPDLRIAKTPFLRWIVSTGDDLPASVCGIETLTAAAATVDDALLRAAEREVHPADQMIEIYTSGSMALPKGVRHNHGPVLFRARYIARMAGIARGKESIAFLPMFWVGGLMIALMPGWIAGATTLCSERTLSNSRLALGTVPAAEDLAMMGKSKPHWGLGMSETLGPYAYGDEVRAPGFPMCSPMDHWAEGFDVRIADAANHPVDDGQVGEVQVRGYAVTPGLHKIERAEHFTADGYYRTGDMALVEGARVHFIGRDGDMIKTMGSNVAPAEVEMELQALDGVQSAYVVGLADSARGQLVAAAVVARGDVPLDFTAIEAALRQRLSGYKVPRAYVAITRDEVPVLPSNKVGRRLLAQLIAERLRRPAA